jgi:hypothetical protein
MAQGRAGLQDKWLGQHAVSMHGVITAHCFGDLLHLKAEGMNRVNESELKRTQLKF